MAAPDPVELTRNVTWSAVSLLAELPRPMRQRLQSDLDWLIESAVSPTQLPYVRAAVRDAARLVDLVEDLRPARRLAGWIRWRLSRGVRHLAGLPTRNFTERPERPGENLTRVSPPAAVATNRRRVGPPPSPPSSAPAEPEPPRPAGQRDQGGL